MVERHIKRTKNIDVFLENENIVILQTLALGNLRISIEAKGDDLLMTASRSVIKREAMGCADPFKGERLRLVKVTNCMHVYVNEEGVIVIQTLSPKGARIRIEAKGEGLLVTTRGYSDFTFCHQTERPPGVPDSSE